MDTLLKDEIHRSLSRLKEGWCWPEKAEAMADLILATKPRSVVEIGVFGGRSLVPQVLALKHVNSGMAVGIDSWRVEHSVEGGLNGANDDWWRSLDLNRIHNEFMHELWLMDLQSHCIIMRTGSEWAVSMFQDRSIDILHIDGNHSEPMAVRDVEIWMPKVRKGGFIWMDDANWPSLQKAVGLLEAKCDRVLDVTAPERLCRLYRLEKVPGRQRQISG